MKRTINTTKIILAVYGILLTWIVLCKMSFSVAEMSWLEGVRAVNLEPFRYSIIDGRIPTRDTVLNLLIFLPLGVYLSMLDVPVLRAVFYGCLISLGFEVSQYALAIGVSDVTDVITNTAGTLIGVVLYAMVRLLFANKRRRDAAINTIAITGLSVFLGCAILLHLGNR